VGLQAQTAQSPYVSVWSRIDGFDPEELSGLIRDRRAVRVALMRSTIHLVGGRDCLRLRPLVQPSIDRQFASSRHSKLAAGVDADEVAAAARALLRDEPVSFTELGRRLAERFPGFDAGALAQLVRTRVPLVQIPPRGLWRQSGAPLCAAAEDWLGKPLARRPSLPGLVRRYLAAFGPASVRDLQAWSGLARMREVVDRLRPELTLFRDERGAELFDLPDSPRPDGGSPVPVRFLADYDNVLLGHADRRRMIADGDRRTLPIGTPTVLVDGFVRATWRFDRAHGKVEVEPLGRLSKTDRGELAAESERLARLLAGPPATGLRATARPA
jgi:Winged helix DNA-binding domain